MALLTRAAPVVGCGAVLSVLSHDAHGRAARLAAALAARIGVECVPVADAAAARVAAARLPGPLVCAAVDRRGLRALADVDANLLLVGPRGDVERLLDGDLVVCLDGSRRAETVLPVAASWAGALTADLWLVSAIASPDAQAVMGRSGDLLQSGYLAGVVGALGGVTGWDVLHGHPAAAVVDLARHGRPGLIALNSHGTTTSPRAPWGRVPARIVLESPCPVLLTRTRVEPSTPPVPRARPVPVPRRRVPGPVIVPMPVRGGDGLAVAARTFLSPSLTPHPNAVAPPRRSHRGAVALALLVAAGLVVAAAQTPLPYHRLGGDTRTARELLSVTGAPLDPSAGTILVTVVTAESVTVADVVRGWLNPSDEVQRDPTGIEAINAQWTNRRLMATAGDTARAVALRHLGLEPATLRIRVTPHGLVGPSAGLAMALELVDLLSPGDLTAGHRVAVSGALAADGRVETVGGIRYKTAAARAAGADVLLVPPSAVGTASIYAGSMRVIPVATFADALAALAALQ